MKETIILVFALFVACTDADPLVEEPDPTGNDIILTGKTIDHNNTGIQQIPEQWIDSAKAKLDIVYWRASHGSQLTEGGMRSLMNYSPAYESRYNFSESGGEGSLKLVEFEADLEHGDTTPGWLPRRLTCLRTPE